MNAESEALSLIAGYGHRADAAAPPMGLRRMVVLAWRTLPVSIGPSPTDRGIRRTRPWPYIRPMLIHLIGVVAVMLAGGLTGLVGAFVGVDLFANKVLVGEKLQPLQATVLFVGEE